MFKNYFKSAWRNLWRNKLYTFLNIGGLTFGICCFLLIGLYLFDELTFDQQHRNVNRIYRVIEHKTVNGEASTVAGASYRLAEDARKSITEVENSTRIQRIGRANILSTDNPTNFFQETVTVADEHFLNIFDFPLIAGDRKTALQEPNAIIINEDLAQRLFNNTNVIGKTLEFSFLDVPLKITGVLKNHNKNSSFDFNSLLSEATFRNGQNDSANASDWLSNRYSVYTLLKPNSNAETVAGKMVNLVKNNFETPPGTTFSFVLQPLKDMHLKSDGILDGARNSNVEAIAQGNPLYIKIFSFVGLFILLIAGINYMNLTTARASGRLKEIGIRKTVGAYKAHIIKQVLLESLIVTAISFILAVFAVNFLLPSFNQFTNKELSLGLSTDSRIWIYSIAFLIIISLLAGSYPAIVLSRFKPVLLLKGLNIQKTDDLSLRKGLVVFQFTISVIMIIGTIVLFLQVRYLNNTNLGFNKDQLVVIDVNTGLARQNFRTVKNEMAKIPSVKNVSVTSRVPGEWKSYRSIKIKTLGSAGDHKEAYMFGADEDFLKTFEMDLVSGRNFKDASDSVSVIINETAARELGITEPTGQTVDIPSVSRGTGEGFTPLNNENIPFRAKVIGIVKDFNFQSLRDKVQPLVLAYTINPIQLLDYYTAKISPDNIQSSLEKLKAVMVANDKNDPFEYHFLDEQIARFYVEDQRRQTILIWIAIATIFIACLGLFGLATYSAQQRLKEISVRKVLGASIPHLASLVSKDFLKLVLIAIVIAVPIAWWASHKWLQEYAYHIDIRWWIFALAGAAAIAIALITVSYQAIKAALTNPVKVLRSE